MVCYMSPDQNAMCSDKVVTSIHILNYVELKSISYLLFIVQLEYNNCEIVTGATNIHQISSKKFNDKKADVLAICCCLICLLASEFS